ncbi:MAG: hypothetical protein FJX48_09095 [Alphaproteobacteria bacterium]|nr:hypothetical protein [Alphaproteobacteria bacterium]
MRRSIALLLSSIVVAGAMSARAEELSPPPPLDVSGWYLRGNVEDPSQRVVEGQSYLQPNLVGDLTGVGARPARYSMSETR